MTSGSNNLHDRPAAVAGRFYPSGKETLEKEVNELLENAKPRMLPGNNPAALIVPHAGYVFSGHVAASAYKQIPADYVPERVFILASSHQMSFPGASVYGSGNYQTPLGTVNVDLETGRKLTAADPLFSYREDAHLFEHSLEVQLPFLQVILGSGFRLVPIILGTRKPEECKQMASTLRPFFTPENLFVISSDFSHYPGYEDAIMNDKVTTEAILSNSPEKLLKTLDDNSRKKMTGLATSLCGWTSVLTLLYLTKGSGYEFHWIDYQNSGDQPLYGDHDRVVGYSAIAVYNTKKAAFTLTLEEKDKLVDIARNSITRMVLENKRPDLDPSVITGNLSYPAGSFVSIYIDGKLRGCIGSFENDTPLAEVVSRSAASAVLDQRFDPVKPEELPGLSIEISVLSPLKRINSPAEIELGRHGIYIRKGWSKGTFLPQVATKYHLSLEEFLGRCSRDKAGLGYEGWKDAELYTYEAIIINSTEKDGEKTSDKCPFA